MIGAIVATKTLVRVVGYSLISGVGIAVIFGLGVSSAAGLLEALRARHTAATVAWGALILACLVSVLGAVVLGIVLMSTK